MMPMGSSAVKPLDGTWGTLWIGSAVLSGSSASSLSEATRFSLAAQSHLDAGGHSLWLHTAINSSSMPVAWTPAHKFLPSPSLLLPLFQSSAACTTESKQGKATHRREGFVGSVVSTLGELALIASPSQFRDGTNPA